MYDLYEQRISRKGIIFYCQYQEASKRVRHRKSSRLNQRERERERN